MNLDFETCKRLIEELKASKKFEIIEDEKPHGFADGIDFWWYTILESANLNVIYASYNLYRENDISVIDKKRNVCIYSNSSFPEDFWRENMTRINIRTLDKLRRHIEERL